MAVPKRKMSRANTRARRSAWKAKLVPLALVKDENGAKVVAPRRLAKAARLGLFKPTDAFEK